MASSAVETVIVPATSTLKGPGDGTGLDSIQLTTLEPPNKSSCVRVDPLEDQDPTPSEKGLFTKTNLHFGALCWCLFLAGWNDGTIGPLLPRVQGVYDVRILLNPFITFADAPCRLISLSFLSFSSSIPS